MCNNKMKEKGLPTVDCRNVHSTLFRLLSPILIGNRNHSIGSVLLLDSVWGAKLDIRSERKPLVFVLRKCINLTDYVFWFFDCLFACTIHKHSEYDGAFPKEKWNEKTAPFPNNRQNNCLLLVALPMTCFYRLDSLASAPFSVASSFSTFSTFRSSPSSVYIFYLMCLVGETRIAYEKRDGYRMYCVGCGFVFMIWMCLKNEIWNGIWSEDIS